MGVGTQERVEKVLSGHSLPHFENGWKAEPASGGADGFFQSIPWYCKISSPQEGPGPGRFKASATREAELARYVHQRIGEEIRSIAGYYQVLEEVVVEYEGRDLFYLLEAAVVDTSCCGSGGMGFIRVPGFVKDWKFGLNEDGLFVSEVERVEGEEERKKIARWLRARHPGFQEVVFM